MNVFKTTVLGLLGLFLVACGTPKEVKELSTAQVHYMDAAAEAVNQQSEVLILAAEAIKEHAEKRIAEIEQENMARFQKLAAETIPNMPAEKRDKTAAEMLKRVADARSTAAQSRQKLEADFQAIRKKSAELSAFVAKLKDVHAALDAYIQLEKAGERFVQDVLNLPGVKTLLDEASGLLPKIQGTTAEIQGLLSVLNK